MLKYIKSKYQLLNELLKTYKKSDYLDFKEKDKTYLELFYEWLFDNFLIVLKYLSIGTLITIAYLTPGIWGLVLKCSVGYWLLFRVLWLIRRGE